MHLYAYGNGNRGLHPSTTKSDDLLLYRSARINWNGMNIFRRVWRICQHQQQQQQQQQLLPWVDDDMRVGFAGYHKHNRLIFCFHLSLSLSLSLFRWGSFELLRLLPANRKFITCLFPSHAYSLSLSLSLCIYQADSSSSRIGRSTEYSWGNLEKEIARKERGGIEKKGWNLDIYFFVFPFSHRSGNEPDVGFDEGSRFEFIFFKLLLLVYESPFFVLSFLPHSPAILRALLPLFTAMQSS